MFKSLKFCKLKLFLQKRNYYYDRDVYGFRLSKEYSLKEYSKQELENRINNSNLVRLVNAYRTNGHRVAQLDPLGLEKPNPVDSLRPERYGLADSDKEFNLSGILHVGAVNDASVAQPRAKLSSILDHLRRTYCGKMAYEFNYIPNEAERRWFAHKVESLEKQKLSSEQRKHLLGLLVRSEEFDHFMARKFPQVKRYGLEGEESMMIVLDVLFREASKQGIMDAVVCMPHRGRLNLLTDLLKVNKSAVFHKIKGNAEFPEKEIDATGDVLSHLSTSVDIDCGAPKPLHVSLLHNPSHLEAANPVAMGKARAKQMHWYKHNTDPECALGDRVVCIQLHGDAAFCGQGVVMETLALSNLPHFTSGGSVHLIVNNQIGYTTPGMNARSTVYSSDVAKMINAPIIHVNADSPEDVAFASQLAYQYRNEFRKDVILDLVGYRRLGHNELDEPAFTQPVMYANIRGRKTVPKQYQEQLCSQNIITPAAAEQQRAEYRAVLDKALEDSYNYEPVADTLAGKWQSMQWPKEALSKVDTGVDEETLRHVANASVTLPSDFRAHSRLKKFHVEQRLQRAKDGQKIDWATAEACAWGSLLVEGYDVRISGQDVGRGTFSQRHCMFVNQEDSSVHIPLNSLISVLPGATSQGKLEIANSSLSEFAVMGFEYGVSWETPQRLCIWEAQFGDFFNGAQIIIDTYLASSETKWLRQSGLVLLLPHGYDGAGPEHSSCRIERFLQLSDDQPNLNSKQNVNWHVVNCTTPAQYFHVLRRQMARPFRKPLIVAAPKILLKSPLAVSDFTEMAPGTSFQPVIGEAVSHDAAAVEKIILVSGKLYYDLVKERGERNLDDKVAIIRVEELAPFPAADISSQLAKYTRATKIIWCQEEPENQGAWPYMFPRLLALIKNKVPLVYHGRPVLSAPAVGISKRHKQEQERVIKQVLDL